MSEILWVNLLLLFVLFLTLGLMLRNRVGISLVLLLLGFLLLLGGPVVVYKIVHHNIYKTKTSVTEVKKLFYSKSLIVKGTLLYLGSQEATRCIVEANVLKSNKNFIEELVQKIKPYKQQSTEINKTFNRGIMEEFKVVFEPFLYEGDYNITVSAECYK